MKVKIDSFHHILLKGVGGRPRIFFRYFFVSMYYLANFFYFQTLFTEFKKNSLLAHNWPVCEEGSFIFSAYLGWVGVCGGGILWLHNWDLNDKNEAFLPKELLLNLSMVFLCILKMVKASTKADKTCRKGISIKWTVTLCIEQWWRGGDDDIKYWLGLWTPKVHFCELWEDTITLHYSLSARSSGAPDIV